MSDKAIRIEFRHPVLGRTLAVDANEAQGRAVLALADGLSREAVAARLQGLLLSLPVEVLDVLRGALAAEVRVDGREVCVGAAFVADMLDTVEDNPEAFLPHAVGVYAGYGLAGCAPLRWLLSFSLASLFLFLNLDPGFYRKCINQPLVDSVRSRQERLCACLNDLDFKER